MRDDLSSHTCTSFCLIRCEHVGFAGLSQSSFETLSERDFLACAKVLKLRLTSSTAAVNKRKNVSFADSPLPQKKTRLMTSSQAGESVRPSTDTYDKITDTFEILPTFEKIKIIEEYCDATSNNALRRYECSFCGSLQPLNCFSKIPMAQLDISLLERAVEELRDKTNQPEIQTHRPQSIIDGCYMLCTLCRREVTYLAFRRIPVRSYANGTWVGDIPDELQGLTFLEEQCIARARATRCMFKLEVVLLITSTKLKGLCLFITCTY